MVFGGYTTLLLSSLRISQPSGTHSNEWTSSTDPHPRLFVIAGMKPFTEIDEFVKKPVPYMNEQLSKIQFNCMFLDILPESATCLVNGISDNTLHKSN
jgi:hypothetical protein